MDGSTDSTIRQLTRQQQKQDDRNHSTRDEKPFAKNAIEGQGTCMHERKEAPALHIECG